MSMDPSPALRYQALHKEKKIKILNGNKELWEAKHSSYTVINYVREVEMQG